MIPDFHSDTKSYLKIKSCYKAKAESDCALYTNTYLKEVLTANSISEDNSPSEEQISVFLKNWLSITAIQYRSLTQEFAEPKKEWIWDGEDANKWYFCVRAADQFFQTHKKFPGPGDETEIEGIVNGLIKQFNFDSEAGESVDIEDKYIQEM